MLTIGTGYNSAANLGMVLPCHNSWPTFRVLFAKVPRPCLIFHFTLCQYNRLFYDPVSQQTNNVCHFHVFLTIESQGWFVWSTAEVFRHLSRVFSVAQVLPKALGALSSPWAVAPLHWR